MILVTGATGNVGAQVALRLRDRGVPFRAFVRDEAKARQMLGEGVELVVGNFEDPPSIQRAMDGVDIVFLCSARHPKQSDHEIAVIDAAAGAGVRRVVKISTVGAEIGSPIIFLDWHGRTEEHLRNAGIPWIIVRGSGFYMTNVMFHAPSVREEGKIFAPAEGAEIAMIDPADVAAAAFVPLTTDGHEGRVYTLTGPAAITYEQIAEDLSRVLDTPVAFVPIPDEAAYQGMGDAGIPEEMAASFLGIFRLMREGLNSTTTDTVRELTGREPVPFADFARRYAAAFGG